jgi:adenosine deaminase
MDAWARSLPKAELHVHIEGTLEPEMVFEFARRNNVPFPAATVAQLRAKYAFTDLQSFLNLYYANMAVLRTELDFTELCDAYLSRAQAAGVRHAEIFFDPQAHQALGVPLGVVIEGLWSSMSTSVERFGISTALIMCFLRDRGAAEARQTLEAALPYRNRLLGVGLDSAEVGHPPSDFVDVFALARSVGLTCVAHAGEEGPPDYVWQAIDLLGVDRIDHGIRCMEDRALVGRLRADQIPLTVCPLSNVRLGVFSALSAHVLPRMLDAGLLVTVNSDDPAYFGGYIDDNYAALHRELGVSEPDLVGLARNSFTAAFLPAEQRDAYLSAIDAIT